MPSSNAYFFYFNVKNRVYAKDFYVWMLWGKFFVEDFLFEDPEFDVQTDEMWLLVLNVNYWKDFAFLSLFFDT